MRPPPADARARWVRHLQAELAHCAEIGLDLSGRGLNLRTMSAHKGTWTWSANVNYAYRTILPNEVVFDIGDHAKDWGEVVDQSEALWDELDEMVHDGAYYAALSGGRGTHTHLWLEDPTDGTMWDGRDWPKHDLREKIADWVKFRRLAKGATVRVQPDPVCIAPSHGGRQLREFGATKMRSKTLLFEGPLQRKPLPRNQAQAYATAGLKYPNAIRRCRSVDGLEHARRRAALGTRCPRSSTCALVKDACQECPY